MARPRSGVQRPGRGLSPGENLGHRRARQRPAKALRTLQKESRPLLTAGAVDVCSWRWKSAGNRA